DGAGDVQRPHQRCTGALPAGCVPGGDAGDDHALVDRHRARREGSAGGGDGATAVADPTDPAPHDRGVVVGQRRAAVTVSPFREDVELARSTETVPYVSEEAFDEDEAWYVPGAEPTPFVAEPEAEEWVEWQAAEATAQTNLTTIPL